MASIWRSHPLYGTDETDTGKIHGLEWKYLSNTDSKTLAPSMNGLQNCKNILTDVTKREEVSSFIIICHGEKYRKRY